MSHVLVRMSGYGLRLVPYWPYRFARTGTDPSSVSVACWAAPGVKEVVVSGTGQRAGSVDGVVDVEKGPGGDWRIETTVFTCAWPEGFTVESPTDPGDATRFYLFGPGDEMIFPQGPAPAGHIPDAAGWAAPGQTVTAAYAVDPGIHVVELAYEHDGVPWWQSHWLMTWNAERTLVVTAQAPATAAEHAKHAASQVATSIQPY